MRQGCLLALFLFKIQLVMLDNAMRKVKQLRGINTTKKKDHVPKNSIENLLE